MPIGCETERRSSFGHKVGQRAFGVQQHCAAPIGESSCPTSRAGRGLGRWPSWRRVEKSSTNAHRRGGCAANERSARQVKEHMRNKPQWTGHVTVAPQRLLSHGHTLRSSPTHFFKHRYFGVCPHLCKDWVPPMVSFFDYNKRLVDDVVNHPSSFFLTTLAAITQSRRATCQSRHGTFAPFSNFLTNIVFSRIGASHDSSCFGGSRYVFVCCMFSCFR
jgi:hypothetical protein